MTTESTRTGLEVSDVLRLRQTCLVNAEVRTSLLDDRTAKFSELPEPDGRDIDRVHSTICVVTPNLPSRGIVKNNELKTPQHWDHPAQAPMIGQMIQPLQLTAYEQCSQQ